jgi:integrase
LPKRSPRKPADRIVRHKLADGSVKTYRYPAWNAPATPAGDTLRGLLRAFEDSPEWRQLSKATQTQYLIYLRPWLEVAETPPREITRREIMAARDVIAKRSGVGAATAFGRVTSALFGWGLDRGWVDFNPAQRLKALPGGSLPAWSEDQISRALESLPEDLRRVVVLGLYTGQRRGDLCAMTWAAYDGATIRLRQAKTGTALTLPAHPELKAELDRWKAERTGIHVLHSPRTGAWTAPHLSREMKRALVKAGLPAGLNVHGLRKAAARRLAEAGCTTHEIASVTGHRSLSMVQHYTNSADQQRLAGAAVSRLPIQNLQIRRKTEGNQ